MTMQNLEFMNWKKWPYWVRGGVLCALAVLVVSAFLMLGESSIIGDIAMLLYTLLFIPLIFLTQDFISTDFIYVFWLVIIYFIIGAFVGWLYGKIKNRNK